MISFFLKKKGGSAMLENFISSVIPSDDVAFIVKTILRLSAAVFLSGFIGGEREHINRPAGIRTHILVCIGAALVTITSEYVCRRYMGIMNVDPTRLGAQVVSGIGFLGAGTIIKEGFSVKGLTTAASLWAVSCVGLACGTGFYSAAIIATLMIYFMLQIMKKFIWNHTGTRVITVVAKSSDSIVREAAEIFSVLSINILSSEIVPDDSNNFMIKYVVNGEKAENIFDFAVTKLRMTDNVVSVHIE